MVSDEISYPTQQLSREDVGVKRKALTLCEWNLALAEQHRQVLSSRGSPRTLAFASTQRKETRKAVRNDRYESLCTHTKRKIQSQRCWKQSTMSRTNSFSWSCSVRTEIQLRPTGSSTKKRQRLPHSSYPRQADRHHPAFLKSSAHVLRVEVLATTSTVREKLLTMVLM